MILRQDMDLEMNILSLNIVLLYLLGLNVGGLYLPYSTSSMALCCSDPAKNISLEVLLLLI